MSDVLEQLRELMKSLGETDYSLQNKTHISQSTIYRIVEGKTSDPGIFKIDNLARAMGHCLSLVPMSEFSQKLQDIDDVQELSKTIAMIESLAEARGYALSPIEKAELILANYKSTSTTESQQTQLSNVVNLKS
ncbi:MAG: helix-turn-helix transcriptional regulator [Gammaproteobacteria bacterium]|nr:helix-turn-helix transcriptional regulator [Gammaproteobacteria bacterium]